MTFYLQSSLSCSLSKASKWYWFQGLIFLMKTLQWLLCLSELTISSTMLCASLTVIENDSGLIPALWDMARYFKTDFLFFPTLHRYHWFTWREAGETMDKAYQFGVSTQRWRERTVMRLFLTDCFQYFFNHLQSLWYNNIMPDTATTTEELCQAQSASPSWCELLSPAPTSVLSPWETGRLQQWLEHWAWLRGNAHLREQPAVSR